MHRTGAKHIVRHMQKSVIQWSVISKFTCILSLISILSKYMHYGCNLGILWSLLKNWIPPNFRIVNFGHPVPKSWLRPCITEYPSIVVMSYQFQVRVNFNQTNCVSFHNESYDLAALLSSSQLLLFWSFSVVY